MAPNNNIDPGARALSTECLPTNLNGPPTIIFKWPPKTILIQGARDSQFNVCQPI